jgi:hypothetical protein
VLEIVVVAAAFPCEPFPGDIVQNDRCHIVGAVPSQRRAGGANDAADLTLQRRIQRGDDPPRPFRAAELQHACHEVRREERRGLGRQPQPLGHRRTHADRIERAAGAHLDDHPLLTQPRAFRIAIRIER